MSRLRNALFLRSFWDQVEQATTVARAKFLISKHHPEIDRIPLTEWLAISLEEFGKISRCVNKLMIAQDPDVRAEWLAELEHRIITTTSVLRRMAEHLPDYHEVDQWGRPLNQGAAAPSPSLNAGEGD